MLGKTFTRVITAIGLAFTVFSAQAGSEVAFPADWQTWKSAQTPLTQIGALPGCDADVSALPPIYQETVEIYCGVKDGGPGAVDVLVRPASLDNYKTRNGELGDGPSMILHLKDMKVLFVSGQQGGKAVYGVYTEDGTDAMSADAGSPLAASTCRECHSGYQAFCVAGQCGTHK